MLIIDASFLLSIILDETTPEQKIEAYKVFNTHKLIAPTLLKLETINTLLVKLRRNQHDYEFCKNAIEFINTLEINYINMDMITTQEAIFELAAHHHLSSYDALYLKLALKMNIKLATNDKKLRDVATLLNLELL